MREGAMHCTLCNKIADQSHLGSLGHLGRMEEDAIATLMAGKTTSTRRLVDGKLGCGCMGVPTRKGIMKHWGDELLCLPMEAKKRHQEMGAIYINSKEETAVKEEHVEGYRLGVVSYKGSGKYAQSSFQWFDDLPDSEEVMDEQWAQKMVLQEDQGWWPVVALELCPQANERVGGPWSEVVKREDPHNLLLPAPWTSARWMVDQHRH